MQDNFPRFINTSSNSTQVKRTFPDFINPSTGQMDSIVRSTPVFDHVEPCGGNLYGAKYGDGIFRIQPQDSSRLVRISEDNAAPNYTVPQGNRKFFRFIYGIIYEDADTKELCVQYNANPNTVVRFAPPLLGSTSLSSVRSNPANTILYITYHGTGRCRVYRVVLSSATQTIPPVSDWINVFELQGDPNAIADIAVNTAGTMVVGIGDGGNVFTSTSGLVGTWTYRELRNTSPFFSTSVVWSSSLSRFFAVFRGGGSDGTVVIHSSTNGTTWSQVHSYTANIDDVLQVPRAFVTPIGVFFTTNTGTLVLTTNGTTFSTITISGARVLSVAPCGSGAVYNLGVSYRPIWQSTPGNATAQPHDLPWFDDYIEQLGLSADINSSCAISGPDASGGVYCSGYYISSSGTISLPAWLKEYPVQNVASDLSTTPLDITTLNVASITYDGGKLFCGSSITDEDFKYINFLSIGLPTYSEVRPINHNGGIYVVCVRRSGSSSDAKIYIHKLSRDRLSAPLIAEVTTSSGSSTPINIAGLDSSPSGLIICVAGPLGYTSVLYDPATGNSQQAARFIISCQGFFISIERPANILTTPVSISQSLSFNGPWTPTGSYTITGTFPSGAAVYSATNRSVVIRIFKYKGRAYMYERRTNSATNPSESIACLVDILNMTEVIPRVWPVSGATNLFPSSFPVLGGRWLAVDFTRPNTDGGRIRYFNLDNLADSQEYFNPREGGVSGQFAYRPLEYL